jgi:hypothetical protein
LHELRSGSAGASAVRGGRAGGGSAAAPIIAGILAQASQAVRNAGAYAFYSPNASVYDVTSGTTVFYAGGGTCTSADQGLCTAGPGYDGPTGVGTPDGIPPVPAAGGPYRSMILADSPAGYWPLGDGGATAADVSGNGQIGTWTAPAAKYLVTGSATHDLSAFGTDFGPSADDAFVTIPDTAAGQFAGTSGDGSLEAWFQAPANSAGTSPAVLAGTGWALSVLPGSQGDQLTFTSTRGTITSQSLPAISAGSWHYLALTIAGTAGTIYVDGRPVGTGTVQSEGTPSTGPLYIGEAENGQAGYHFDGTLDQVAAYSFALSPQQIARHAGISVYDATILADGATSLWPLNDTGPTATDFVQGATATWTNPAGKSLIAGPQPADVVNQGTYTGTPTSNAYLTIPGTSANQFAGTSGDGTVEMWFQGPSDGPDDSPTLISGNGWNLSVFPGTEGDQVSFQSRRGSLMLPTLSSITSNSTWHLLDVTISGTTLTIYIDGQPIATRTAGTATDSLGNLLVGENVLAPTQEHYDGAGIADVAFYGTALSAATVLSHYNAS